MNEKSILKPDKHWMEYALGTLTSYFFLFDGIDKFFHDQLWACDYTADNDRIDTNFKTASGFFRRIDMPFCNDRNLHLRDDFFQPFKIII